LYAFCRAKLKIREEYVVAMTAMGEEDKLLIYSGKKHMTMKSGDQEYYIGERGRRGNMLARNYGKVIRIKAEG